MNHRHFITRFKQLEILAKQSTCIRRGVAAMVIDEDLNMPLCDGINGTPPNTPNQCGGHNVCLRDKLKIPSGTDNSTSCDHAERALIYRAANYGIRLNGKTMMVTCAPCLDCAKAIVRTGIKKVMFARGLYPTTEGVDYLIQHDVVVFDWDSSYDLEELSR